MGIFNEFWEFLKERKKFWLLPIIVFVLLFSVLAFVASSSGALSPFIYALF